MRPGGRALQCSDTQLTVNTAAMAQQFSQSWEALDRARNPDQYEVVRTEEGREVTFLKQSDTRNPAPQTQFTQEEEENIARAAEQMQDRED